MKEQWSKFGIAIMIIGLIGIIYAVTLGFQAWIMPVTQGVTLEQARSVEIESTIIGVISAMFLWGGFTLWEATP